jgi:catechol 2,3-dioxygenase-like lactoylglutathione lyase family enzyme
MPRVLGLGHLGIYVRDLERMVAFYRDFLGMQVTKRNANMVFLSADPAAVDHEIALIRGRPEGENPHLIDQISLRVATLDDLREFHRRLRAEGYRIDAVVNHGSAIGCYFFDPEGNRTELFWLTGRTSWAVMLEPIDLDQPDEVIMAQVDRAVERVRGIPMGGLTEPQVVAASSG